MNLSFSQIIRHLPRLVTFADGHITEYLYDAAGGKRQTKYLVDNRTVFAAMALGETESDEVMEASDSTAIETLLTRDYCGDYIYEDRELERISTANGYISPSGVYTFYISDYQGNIVNLTPSTRISNWSEYYPFGVHHSLTSSDRYLYSGKELDKINGLYLYDFHARHYDPMLARFTTIDPLCEKYYPISPYAYCAGNPIRYIDPTGLFKISSEDAKLAPKLAHYIQNDIHKVYNNPQIRNALKKYGEFSNESLLKALTFGDGPTIKFSANLPSDGAYYPQKDPNSIYLNINLPLDIEFSDSQIESDANLFYNAVTILHELVHYGDNQDGKDQIGEEGYKFEIEAYGHKITNVNVAVDLILKYLNIQQNNNTTE